jgi:hypothetical protein
MIKQGLRGDSETEADAAMHPFADELLTLLVEMSAEYQESGDAEILATLDARRRELAAADAAAIPALAGSCLDAVRTAVKRARDRQAEQDVKLARFVVLVRDAAMAAGGEGDDVLGEPKDATDCFAELLEISDGGQLNTLLAQEVEHLHRLAAERQKLWCRATATFMVRVASLERQLGSGL